MSDRNFLPDPQTYPYHRYIAAVQKSAPEHAPPNWPSRVEYTVYEKQVERLGDGPEYFVWVEVAPNRNE